MAPLIRPSGTFPRGVGKAVLTEHGYLKTNEWFLSIKKKVAGTKWTHDKTVPEHILNATTVIGMINCFRLVVRHQGKLTSASYDQKLVGIDDFPFKSYKSSQYGAMGRDMYALYYEKSTSTSLEAQ